MVIRALWRPGLVLFTVCLVASGLAIFVPGRTIVPPAALGALGFSACAPPCWAGITVGETVLADVEGQFEAYVNARHKQLDQAAGGVVYWGVTNAADGNLPRTMAFSGNLLARTETRHVTYLHLNLGIPVWYLLLTLGQPDGVELHEPFPGVSQLELVLQWTLPGLRAAAVVPLRQDQDWGLSAQAASFSIAEPGPREGFGRSLRAYHTIGRTGWRGFAPISHYLREASFAEVAQDGLPGWQGQG